MAAGQEDRTHAPSPAMTAPTRLLNAAEKAAFDAALVRAFRDLETSVCELRGTWLGAEIICEDVLSPVEDLGVKEFKAALPVWAEHRVFVLTKEQADAFMYAFAHVGTLVLTLHETYYAAFEADPRRTGPSRSDVRPV